MNLLWGLLALAGLLGGANVAIRRGLAAPRVVEAGSPQGLPWREVRLPTVNGKHLFGWFIPAGERAPALVVMHGWGGNAGMMLPLAAPLHEHGYALLLVDARCHGQSDDDSFASLPRFAEDIDAALAWLARQPEVDAARLGVIGHSVGAGAALLAASRRRDLRAVVSLAAFAHPAGMMRRWLASKRIPHWPFGAYILAYVQRVIGFRFDDIAPCHTIARVTCPVLLVHGLEDDTVPVDEARQIHAARSSDAVELLLVPGSHDDYGDVTRHLAQLGDFLDRETAPTEAEQRAAYQAVIDGLDGRSAIIRTLDVGADKSLPYIPMPEEENPALGLRGIRLCLARQALLVEQLRAILAVQPLNAVKIMLPMVVDASEIVATRVVLDRLTAEMGIAGRVELGVMIETPSAAILADQLAKEADFFSVGTNDLTQYALCMDRTNPALAARVDGLHPAVLRLLAQAAQGAAKQGKWLGVCGAMASDRVAVPLLIGLGVTELSVSPAVIP